MSFSIQTLRGGVLLLSLAAAGLLTTGCNKDEKKASSQVAIKVNGEEVSVHQVDLLLQRQAGAAQSDLGTRRVLEGLVDQELAAQAARKDKLEQDPKVVQMMEAAKREVLARAYLDRIGSKVTEPSSDEIDRYYNEHPNLFSERRLYTLQETTVGVPAERAEAVKARLQAASGVDKLNEAVRLEELRSSTRQISVSAEDVPLTMLDQLAALRPGQSLVLPGEGSLRALTLLHSETSPVARTAANRLIAAFLVNERKRQLLQDGVKALRDQAKVEYQGRFAQLPAAGASAPASVPAASPAGSAPASAAQ